MHFVSHLQLPSKEVLRRLDSLPRERGQSWAASTAWAASTGRMFTRVEGETFQVSSNAGMSMLGPIGNGQVERRGAESEVHVTFRYGVAPSWLPRLAFGLNVLCALATTPLLYTDQSLPFYVVGALLPLTALFWFATSSEVRFLLRELSESLGGATWSAASQ